MGRKYARLNVALAPHHNPKIVASRHLIVERSMPVKGQPYIYTRAQNGQIYREMAGLPKA